MKFDHYKKFINVALDLLLGLLAIVVVIFMLRYIIDIGSLILRPLSADLFGKVIQEVTSFFMLFEFVIMLIRYIEEGHHIPIRYLILISMTAILRQLLVLHDRGTETLLLTLAILVLAGVLTVFSFVSGDFKHSRGEKDIDIDQHF
ncbi:phosphate-starvation-inducible protein PsiE [Lacticaseibacillus rhamnosus]|uniref:phosphate-starvation-inducible protein PsiE n=1 Tax=Lacticaseibacillus rhamnosus TaxID=47715 RepID=UPI00237E2BB5|nr:phosphate-starvation-inducible protein PsiE [Lacticaseibacillus rhamnosus]MDE3300052.1 phosphate-starvation-inducible protein PsiE [Lacticaseibacillus rhamnosus]